MCGWNPLDEVGNVHGHLLDGGVVEGLDVPQGALVVLRHHVDGHTLPTKATSAPNPSGGGGTKHRKHR